MAMVESRRGGQSWIELGIRARTLTITEAEERIQGHPANWRRPPGLSPSDWARWNVGAGRCGSRTR